MDVYLNFSKAFDGFYDNILVVSLRRNGVGGNTVGWVAVWLYIGGACCMYFALPTLGPVLSMFFINNLIDGRECTLIAFMMTPNWGDIGKCSSLCR